MDTVILLTIVCGLVAVAVGAATGYRVRQARLRTTHDPVKLAEAANARLDAETETRVKEILLQAQDEAVRLRTTAEEEHRGRRAEIQRQERRLQQKEENLDRKLEELDQRERALQTREREIDARRAPGRRAAGRAGAGAGAALRPDRATRPARSSSSEVEQDVREACARRAARDRAGGGRAGRALGAADHRHGDPALLERPGRRVDDVRRPRSRTRR